MKELESWIWAILVVGTLGLCGWAVYEFIRANAEVAAAIVGVGGIIVGAYVKHGFDLEKERRHTLFLEKQSNYKKLLVKVADFAQDNGKSTPLSSAHLASWAFGDLQVLQATNAFQSNPNQDSLLDLLDAIRQSLQGSNLPKEFKNKYNVSVLFPSSSRGLPPKLAAAPDG